MIHIPRNRFSAFLLTLLVILMPACGQRAALEEAAPAQVSDSARGAGSPVGGVAAAPETQGRSESQVNLAAVEKRLIKTGRLRLQVKDYAAFYTGMKKQVEVAGGYIQSEQEQTQGGQRENTLVIRIPAAAFDKLMNGLAGDAVYVHHRQVDVQDVTEEYVDLEARLKAKREVEKRYLEILSKADTINETLAVEESLGRIREEIESREGRRRFLEHQVSFSTIHLDFYQPGEVPVEPGAGFFGKLGDALSGGWEFLQLLTLGLFYLWPLWIVVILVVWWIRRVIRKRREKRAAAIPSPATADKPTP